jgi:serine/threonine-protein kinase HipA
LQATSQLTKNAAEVERAFRLMVFNVLAHNKDDHAKNFSFVADHQGWKLSPGFDLTFSDGMGGEHTTAISGHGNPGLETVLKVGRKFHLHRARQIVEEVRHAVSQWSSIAGMWGVSRKSSAGIQKALSVIDKQFLTA